MMEAKKSLGQHWLADEEALDSLVNAADIVPGDTILEVGPGTGNLTKKLLESGAKVIAVEKDEALARQLPKSDNLQIIEQDILKFDFGSLPADYKVVANIPYYLTSHLLRVLTESSNPPAKMVLLVQKEVAERICAKPGQMSVLSVSVQLDYECQLGEVVPSELFEPPPKVDSQVVILNRRVEPPFKDLNRQKFFKVVKAGFSARRKKLRSALAGGLSISREEADQKAKQASINPNRRAQELNLEDWYRLSQIF